MAQQKCRLLRVMAALLTFALLFPFILTPTMVHAADDTALRDAIAKHATTYTRNMAVRNDGVAMFESEILETWTNVASVPHTNSELQYPVALRWDGTVLTADNDPKVAAWRNIIAIYVFGDDIIGLRLDGTVVSTNPKRVCTTWTNVEYLQIPFCFGGMYAVTKSGKVLSEDSSMDLSMWTDIVQINNGMSLIGLRKNGTVLYYDGTQTKVMEGWTDVVAVDCYWYPMALRRNGTILTDAESMFGETLDFSNWNNLVGIHLWGCNYIGIKADGSLVDCGLFELTGEDGPDFSLWTNMLDVRTMSYCPFGLRADGTVLLLDGPYTKYLFLDVQLPYDSSAAKSPSDETLAPFGAVIVYPKDASYLPHSKTKFVQLEALDNIPVYWDPDNTSRKRMYVLYDNDMVTVLAEQNGLSCVIFTDTAGQQQIGWVSSTFLTETIVQPSYGPSEKDLTPFGSVIVYPRRQSYLPDYETKYVKVSGGKSITVYWDPSDATKRRVHVLDDCSEVTVLAEESGRSCVIFKDTAGKEQLGWVDSEYLVDEKPKPYLGITVSDVFLSDGVYVHTVLPGFCSQKAGLQANDVIVSLGHCAVKSVSALNGWVLNEFRAGETTTITVVRNGNKLVLPITLDKAP